MWFPRPVMWNKNNFQSGRRQTKAFFPAHPCPLGRAERHRDWSTKTKQLLFCVYRWYVGGRCIYVCILVYAFIMRFNLHDVSIHVMHYGCVSLGMSTCACICEYLIDVYRFLHRNFPIASPCVCLVVKAARPDFCTWCRKLILCARNTRQGICAFVRCSPLCT